MTRAAPEGGTQRNVIWQGRRIDVRRCKEVACRCDFWRETIAIGRKHGWSRGKFRSRMTVRMQAACSLACRWRNLAPRDKLLFLVMVLAFGSMLYGVAG
jgi:hypothetical protein